MLLESVVLGLCLNAGHCDDLARHYFHYNPVAVENISQLQQKAENVIGREIIHGVAPFASFMYRREATMSFPENKTITLEIKPDKIGLRFDYNF